MSETKNLTPNEFVAACTEAFVGVAQAYGLAEAGAIYQPQLCRKGEKAVVELLKLRGFIKAYGDDPMMYYYHILSLSLSMGVVLGMLFHNAKDKFREKDTIPMICNDPETSPHSLAFHTLSQFGVSADCYNRLVQSVYEKFIDLHKPYWKVVEPRDYTISAFIAGFLAGSSIVLAKCGYSNAGKA